MRGERLVVLVGRVQIAAKGGISEAVWLYAANNGGLASEASYPYQDPSTLPGGTDWYATATCTATTAPVVPGTQPDPANPFTSVPNTVVDISAALVKQPVTVTIAASCPLLQSYSGGVLSDTSCLAYNDRGWRVAAAALLHR